MADLQAVYARTPAGLAEIKARAFQLTREQRNLLIVLDGKSPLADFVKLARCTPEEMGNVVAPLVQQGLIAPAGGVSAGASFHALVSLAERVFGAQADPVVRKLGKADASQAELLTAAEGAAKLAKLTIDEGKAGIFVAEARKLLTV